MPYSTETDYLTEAYEGYGAHLPAYYGQEEVTTTTEGGGIFETAQDMAERFNDTNSALMIAGAWAAYDWFVRGNQDVMDVAAGSAIAFGIARVGTAVIAEGVGSVMKIPGEQGWGAWLALGLGLGYRMTEGGGIAMPTFGGMNYWDEF
ncbi:hypothetical protein CMI47_02935 [Candidatus Pacearchaeota archaeon]|nr:hypothetical protein [Candidatus Pacearchaeota archaeon]|tara:strand:- start:220 stop:663 length:444 start_codon:yes stop_codon:yes gene_type:complete